MTKDEALKMAYDWVNEYAPPEVVQACKEALEQPSQEPVAWMEVKKDAGFKCIEVWQEPVSKNSIPLYTHPAPSWQGLSDDEIDDISICEQISPDRLWHIYVAIEQALKEKNKC